MNNLYLLILLVNIAAAAAWFFMILIHNNDQYALLVLAHAGMSGLIFFPAFARQKIDKFDPLNLFIVYTIIGGIAPSYYILFDQTPRISYLMARRDVDDFVDAGVWYCISLILVGVGYAVCKRRVRVEKILPSERNLSGRGFQFALIVGIAISAIGVSSYISSTGGLSASISEISQKRSIEVISNGEVVHATGGYMRMAADISVILLLVTMSYYLKRFRRMPAYVSFQIWILGALSLIVPFISSSRSAVVFVALGIMISLHSRDRLSPKIVLVCVLFAAISFGAMSALRAASQSSQNGAFENPFEALAESGNGLSLFGTTHVIKGVPERMDFQLGSTYTSWIFAPVPRSIWPEKPDISLGKRVKDEILQLPVIRSGRPASFMGEGWINFGAIGFILNSVIIGYSMRLISNSLLPVVGQSSFAVPVYFTLALNTTALTNSAISQGIVRIMTDLVLLFVVYILIQHSFSKKSAPIRWRFYASKM